MAFRTLVQVSFQDFKCAWHSFLNLLYPHNLPPSPHIWSQIIYWISLEFSWTFRIHLSETFLNMWVDKRGHIWLNGYCCSYFLVGPEITLHGKSGSVLCLPFWIGVGFGKRPLLGLCCNCICVTLPLTSKLPLCCLYFHSSEQNMSRVVLKVGQRFTQVYLDPCKNKAQWEFEKPGANKKARRKAIKVTLTFVQIWTWEILCFN